MLIQLYSIKVTVSGQMKDCPESLVQWNLLREELNRFYDNKQ